MRRPPEGGKSKGVQGDAPWRCCPRQGAIPRASGVRRERWEGDAQRRAGRASEGRALTAPSTAKSGGWKVKTWQTASGSGHTAENVPEARDLELGGPTGKNIWHCGQAVHYILLLEFYTGRGHKKRDPARTWKLTVEEFDRNRGNQIQRSVSRNGCTPCRASPPTASRRSWPFAPVRRGTPVDPI